MAALAIMAMTVMLALAAVAVVVRNEGQWAPVNFAKAAS
jgi:hypothetical protein